MSVRHEDLGIITNRDYETLIKQALKAHRFPHAIDLFKDLKQRFLSTPLEHQSERRSYYRVMQKCYKNIYDYVADQHKTARILTQLSQNQDPFDSSIKPKDLSAQRPADAGMAPSIEQLMIRQTPIEFPSMPALGLPDEEPAANYSQPSPSQQPIQSPAQTSAQAPVATPPPVISQTSSSPETNSLPEQPAVPPPAPVSLQPPTPPPKTAQPAMPSSRQRPRNVLEELFAKEKKDLKQPSKPLLEPQANAQPDELTADLNDADHAPKNWKPPAPLVNELSNPPSEDFNLQTKSNDNSEKSEEMSTTTPMSFESSTNYTDSESEGYALDAGSEAPDGPDVRTILGIREQKKEKMQSTPSTAATPLRTLTDPNVRLKAAQSLVEDAESLLSKETVEQATDKLLEAQFELDGAGGDETLQQRIAQVQDAIGSLLTKSNPLPRDHEVFSSTYLRGLQALAAGDYTSARDLFLQRVQQAPTDRAAHIRLEECMEALNGKAA